MRRLLLLTYVAGDGVLSIRDTSHSVDYPGPMTNLSCAEALAVLASPSSGGGAVPYFNFYSQYHQDWVLAAALGWGGRTSPLTPLPRGTFIDLATNDPILGSNTLFLERCLGWKGVCIEPNEQYHASIRSQRSCHLVPSAVAQESHYVTMTNEGSTSHIDHGAPAARGGANATSKVWCTTLRHILHARRLTHIDFLSLDIEGHELSALQGVDWDTTTIDMILIENSSPAIAAYLRLRGIWPRLCIGIDTLFVRGNATTAGGELLTPRIQGWFSTFGKHLLPQCVRWLTTASLITYNRGKEVSTCSVHQASFRGCKVHRYYEAIKGRWRCGFRDCTLADRCGSYGTCAVFAQNYGYRIGWRNETLARRSSVSRSVI